MNPDRHLRLVADLRPAPIVDPDRWQTQGACVGMDANVFFPEEQRGRQSPDRWGPAIAVCSRCPVRERCLQYAIDEKLHDGVYGGLTPTQRKRDRQRTPRPSTTTKQCSKCGDTKPLYQFHRRSNSPDGHKPHCATCVANYDADRQPRRYSKEARG